MENTIIAKVEEVMKDQAFVEQLFAAETHEAAQALFAARGVEFTLEEVKQIGAGLKAAAEANGELSADDLEAVAGGIALTTVAAVVSIISGCVTIVDFVGKRAGWWK